MLQKQGRYLNFGGLLQEAKEQLYLTRKDRKTFQITYISLQISQKCYISVTYVNFVLDKARMARSNVEV